MRKPFIAVAACAPLFIPAVAAGQQSQLFGLRIGNADWGGSESLTDSRTTGAEFSGGTRAGTHPQFGSILGPDGVFLPFGEVRGDSTRSLTAPRTTGAAGSGGTPSRTGGAR